MMGQAITYGTYVTFTVCCQYHNFMRDFFYYFQTNKFHDITNAHSPPIRNEVFLPRVYNDNSHNATHYTTFSLR